MCAPIKETSKDAKEAKIKQEELLKVLEAHLVELVLCAKKAGVKVPKRLKKKRRYKIKPTSGINFKIVAIGTDSTDDEDEEMVDVNGSELNDVKGTGPKDQNDDDDSMCGMLLNLKLEHS